MRFTCSPFPRKCAHPDCLISRVQSTGYGVKTIPGVREAIEQKRWKEAEEQAARAAKALEQEAGLIDSAARELERGRQ